MKLIKVAKKISKKVDAYEEYLALTKDIVKNFKQMDENLDKLNKDIRKIIDNKKIIKVFENNPDDSKIREKMQDRINSIFDIDMELNHRGISFNSLKKADEKYQSICEKIHDCWRQLDSELKWKGKQTEDFRKRQRESPIWP